MRKVHVMESGTWLGLTERGRLFFLSCAYGLLLFVSALFGGVLSNGAQRGGITFGNAILAVLLGPWSEILPPNAHAISSWNVNHTLFAICLTALLGFTVAGSCFARRRWLRRSSTVLSILALVAWVLAGLLKVATELT